MTKDTVRSPERRGTSHNALMALAAVMVAIFAGTGANAEFAIPGFELVHNAPVETSLATPDVRDPVTVWCELIDGAHRSIDLEQYYVAGVPGSRLDKIINALQAASRRGVHIRFLMEKKGLSSSDTATIDRLRSIPNLEFRMLAWADVNGDGIIHAKYFVVDGRSAYVGSQNFDWRSLEHIDETGLRITDSKIVGQLHRIFEQDWRAQSLIAAGKHVTPLRKQNYSPLSKAGFLVASPNAFDPPDVADSQAVLLKLLAAAKKEIHIEVMEYSTFAFGGGEYRLIDEALRAAAARGVHVRLMIADWDLTPSKLPGLESLAAVPNVEIKVAAIPQASTGFIPYARVVHTKVMEIDGAIAWIGTSNWEGGYLDTSRNLELVLPSRSMAARIASMEAQLWDSPYARPLAEAKFDPPPRRGE